MLRALVTAAVLVAIYYLVPLDGPVQAEAVVGLTLGLLGVSAIIAWQVRAIVKADHPAVRAVQALAIIAPLFLLLFASGYYLMEQTTGSSFSQPMSRTDSLYFTVTTFSTVGFGDITPTSEAARVAVTVQMLADLVILGFGVKVIVGAVQMGRQRQAGSADDQRLEE